MGQLLCPFNQEVGDDLRFDGEVQNKANVEPHELQTPFGDVNRRLMVLDDVP
jgi:hypothetical protein